MPAERTRMRHVREVLRFTTAGVGLNEIARRVGVAPSLPRLAIAALQGLSFPRQAMSFKTCAEQRCSRLQFKSEGVWGWNAMHVLVCGGGVIGASVAYFLSCRGVKATVIESTGLACAASGNSGGFLARD